MFFTWLFRTGKSLMSIPVSTPLFDKSHHDMVMFARPVTFILNDLRLPKSAMEKFIYALPWLLFVIFKNNSFHCFTYSVALLFAYRCLVSCILAMCITHQYFPIKRLKFSSISLHMLTSSLFFAFWLFPIMNLFKFVEWNNEIGLRNGLTSWFVRSGIRTSVVYK